VPVDLRSDTVTRPTRAMRAAMADAEVGDDIYGEDPTVNALQDEAASLLGKEAALYVPSGTMGNQLALRVLTRPGDAVIAGPRQHIVAYEDGAGPLNSGITWLPVSDDYGTLDPGAVRRAALGWRNHLPRASLVAVENTHMAAGGTIWPAGKLAEVAEVATQLGLSVHLDGARLWHAAVAMEVEPAAVAAPATTVMCCLSKGLSAPIGSLLAGPADVIDEARLGRHRLGGGWRQAGIIAAAGLVALRTMRERLAEDHARARRLAEVVAERWPDAGLEVADVMTNIVVFAHPDPEGLLRHLAEHDVLAGTVGPGRVRLVTHHDVDDTDIERAALALAKAPR
jgi:threonine aldolase